MTVSVLGAMRLTGSLVLDNDTGVFPSNPKVGTMHVKGETLYTYLTIAGVTNWFPLARLPERYVHTQTAPSDNWVVQHNLNNQDVWYQIQDSNGQITTPANFVKVDDNTFNLVFTEPCQGKVLVLATGLDGNEQPGVTIANIKDWPTAVSAAEVAQLDGVTSPIQTQLNTLTAGLANVQVGPISLSSVSDWPSAVSATEVGYLDGVTSSVQLQLNGKATPADVDTRIQAVVGAAPAALDTLAEIAAQLAADETAAAALTNTVSLKADKTYVDAGLAALNASNLTTGTVPTARLGTGTASASTYLRGDGTWATVSSTPTSLTATSVISYDGYTSGVFAGMNNSTGAPVLGLVNASAPANARFNQISVDASNGRLNFAFINDVGATASSWMSVDRSGNTATALTLTANAISLVGPVTATSFSGSGASLTNLNASNLGSGTVPTARLGSGTADATTYLRGDGTWATVAGGGGGTPGGATTQVQYNNSGAFAGSANFTFNSGTGVVSATGFAGSGASLTALNASSLATGTVDPARMGSGTASTSTYLRGDGTWATLSSTSTNLTATSALTVNGATTGTFIYVTSSRPYTTTVNTSAPAGAQVSDFYVSNTDGSLNWRLVADGNGTAANWMTLTRSANTATNLTIAATAITLNAAVTGTNFSGVGTNLTALNASNLASGTVPTARLGSGTASGSTYLRGDGTWATVSTGTASGLVATATTLSSISTTAVTIGVHQNFGTPAMWFNNASAPADCKMYFDQVNASGSRQFYTVNDAQTNIVTWMQVDRTGNSASNITLTGTAITLNGAVTATSLTGAGSGITALNASNLASGTAPVARLGTGTASASTFLRGDGTWTSQNLLGTVAVPAAATVIATSGSYNGSSGTDPWHIMTNSGAAAGNKYWLTRTNTSGVMTHELINDAASGAATYMSVTRSGNTASTIALNATSITLQGNTTPAVNNAYTLGASGAVWASVWAATATIQTSDARTKNTVENSVLGLDFINALRPVSYKFNVGRNEVTPATYDLDGNELTPQVVTPVAGSRTHWGLIAQEVKTVVDASGVDFAGWVIDNPADPESAQGLRYEQFVSPLIKAVQELTARDAAKQTQIDALTARIAAIEKALGM